MAANPNVAALIGALTLVPFLTANAIVANRIEPFFSLIRPGPHTSAREYVLLFVVVCLLAVGAVIAARPMLGKGMNGRRRFHVLNALVAAFLVAVFVALSVALGSEIYRCDVLQVPNCD